MNTFYNLSTVLEGKSVGQKSMPSLNGFGNPYGTAEQMGTAPWHNAAEDYEPKVDVSYTAGKHAMKYRLQLQPLHQEPAGNGDTQGQFAFGGTSSGQFTGNLASCGTGALPACIQGDGLMDMLLGMPSSYDQQASAPIRHYVNQTPSVYAWTTGT